MTFLYRAVYTVVSDCTGMKRPEICLNTASTDWLTGAPVPGLGTQVLYTSSADCYLTITHLTLYTPANVIVVAALINACRARNHKDLDRIDYHGKSASNLRSVTCHMGSHSVTCHPTQVNAPRHNPCQTGWFSI